MTMLTARGEKNAQFTTITTPIHQFSERTNTMIPATLQRQLVRAVRTSDEAEMLDALHAIREGAAAGFSTFSEDDGMIDPTTTGTALPPEFAKLASKLLDAYTRDDKAALKSAMEQLTALVDGMIPAPEANPEADPAAAPMRELAKFSEHGTSARDRNLRERLIRANQNPGAFKGLAHASVEAAVRAVEAKQGRR